MPPVDSNHGFPSYNRQVPVSRTALELFFDDILERPVLQAQISKHLFQSAVLILEFLEPFNIRGFHTTVFRFTVVISRIRDAVFTADLLNHSAAFDLFYNSHDLCFAVV